MQSCIFSSFPIHWLNGVNFQDPEEDRVTREKPGYLSHYMEVSCPTRNTNM